MDPVVLNWAGGVVIVGSALGILWKIFLPLIKKTKALLNALDRFIVDWFGEDSAPGRDRVPGVMERLNNIDGELKHNGGSSMKDAIKRVEQKLSEIDERLEEGNQRFERIEKRIK